MADKTKIVLIGAGSAQFGISCLRDAFCHPGIFGNHLVFMDINEINLNRIVKIAVRMNKELKACFKISSATNLEDALPDADFVITSIAVDRNEMWKQDFMVPKKYGVRHVLGENGGPGAVFHTLRTEEFLLKKSFYAMAIRPL